MHGRYNPILFDLDGTLTDPEIGITRSVQYALQKLGFVVEDRRTLLPCIGPPLHRSFQAYCDGSELDGTRTEKAEVIAAALAAVPGIDPARALMVGDREHDTLGARANHIAAVAVGYGFGSATALHAAAPDYHAATLADLAALFDEH